MKEKAIEKLKSEANLSGGIAKLRDLLVEALGKGDEQLANAVMDEKKNMTTCFKHITNWARSKAVAGCAMIDSDSVLGEAIHYFLDVKEEEKKPEPKPVLKKPETATAPAKPVASKKTVEKEPEKVSEIKSRVAKPKVKSEPKLEVEVFDLFA